MMKTIVEIGLGLALTFSAMHCFTLEPVLSQETSGTGPTESAQSASPSSAPVPEPPTDLDFNMDTTEFDDFGKEDFVVDEPLDPKTETALTAVKVIASVVGLLIVFWLIRKVFGGRHAIKE